jgi:carbon storage regulator
VLVLTRYLGEEIVIAGNVRVKVIGLRNRHVRLGIVAPTSVTVDRKEIHQRRSEFRDTRDKKMSSARESG